MRGLSRPPGPLKAAIFVVLGLGLGFAGACRPAGDRDEAAKEERVVASPPNILLIFTDDAGYADFGFQGSKTHATPSIDELAASGILCTQAYVTASVCSPSRAGLLTGRYQQRFGHEYNLPGMKDSAVPPERRGLPLSEKTMADYLRAEGYRTGLIGKWHLGTEAHFHPLERGFDEFFGMLKGSGPYTAGKARGILDGREDVDPKTLPYLTDAFAARAEDFIRRHRDLPFFLYLSLTAPHGPLQARPDHLEALRPNFETAARAKNAAMTRSIDEAVARIRRALEETEQLENTLIVFTNDNGGAMPYNASLNEPLRGTKGTCLEGGNRVPMVISWPAGLASGKRESRPISTLDLLPTFLAAAGAEPPEPLDGVNVLPHLGGATKAPPHSVLFWKLNWGAAIRKGDWKLVRTPAEEYWLFDLAQDPGEVRDLAAENPGLRDELRRELEAWEAELPKPIWKSAPRWRAHSLERYDQEKVDGWRRR